MNILMNELAEALTEAIKATQNARSAIYSAASAADDIAQASAGAADAIGAGGAGIREGELLSYATILSVMTRELRAMRRDVARKERAS